MGLLHAVDLLSTPLGATLPRNWLREFVSNVLTAPPFISVRQDAALQAAPLVRHFVLQAVYEGECRHTIRRQVFGSSPTPGLPAATTGQKLALPA